jgi:hypothetical protein
MSLLPLIFQIKPALSAGLGEKAKGTEELKFASSVPLPDF